jgi:hypothetical protein
MICIFLSFVGYSTIRLVSEADMQHTSIISGTGAAISSKTNFGLLLTITLEVIPFFVYAPLATLLPFLNAS